MPIVTGSNSLSHFSSFLCSFVPSFVRLFIPQHTQFVYWSWISNSLYHAAMGAMQGMNGDQIVQRIQDVLWDTQKVTAQFSFFFLSTGTITLFSLAIRHLLLVLTALVVFCFGFLLFWSQAQWVFWVSIVNTPHNDCDDGQMPQSSPPMLDHVLTSLHSLFLSLSFSRSLTHSHTRTYDTDSCPIAQLLLHPRPSSTQCGVIDQHCLDGTLVGLVSTPKTNTNAQNN